MANFTPGPWRVGYEFRDIGCENAKIGGYTKLFDVRGWGYLTGHGDGGLGLSAEDGYEVQKANARLAAAAPDLLDALKSLIGQADEGMLYKDRVKKVLAAIAKAEGRDAP